MPNSISASANPVEISSPLILDIFVSLGRVPRLGFRPTGQSLLSEVPSVETPVDSKVQRKEGDGIVIKEHVLEFLLMMNHSEEADNPVPRSVSNLVIHIIDTFVDHLQDTVTKLELELDTVELEMDRGGFALKKEMLDDRRFPKMHLNLQRLLQVIAHGEQVFPRVKEKCLTKNWFASQDLNSLEELIGRLRRLKENILCLHGSPDGPEQYVAVMNAIFSAQRSMVPIDSCVLGSQHSPFLQQASYISGGVYLKPQLLDGLFQYLSTDGTYARNIENLVPKVCILACKNGDYQLQASSLQCLEAMIWFMAEFSNIFEGLDEIVHVVLENYEPDMHYEDGETGDQRHHWVDEVVRCKGKSGIDGSPSRIIVRPRPEKKEPTSLTS